MSGITPPAQKIKCFDCVIYWRKQCPDCRYLTERNVRLKILDVKQKLSDVLLNTSHEELIDVVSIQLQELEKICDFIKSSEFKEKTDVS